MRLLATITLCSLLAGCGLIEASQPPGPEPSYYKATVADYMKTTFFDPYSFRDVKISPPQQGVLGYTSGWIVCVELNAKNRMGGYVGLKRWAFLIKNDEVRAAVEMASVCDEVNLSSWPEMEGEHTGKVSLE